MNISKNVIPSETTTFIHLSIEIQYDFQEVSICVRPSVCTTGINNLTIHG